MAHRFRLPAKDRRKGPVESGFALKVVDLTHCVKRLPNGDLRPYVLVELNR